MNHFTRIILLLFIAALLILAPGAPANAQASAGSCEAGKACVYLPAIAQAVLTPAGRAYAKNLWDQVYNTPTPDIGWTGSYASCSAGATSQGWRDAVLRRINYFREMAGLPAASLDNSYNQEAQAAALIMSAQGGLSHDPPSNWGCWSQLGHDGAGSSNLFLGVNGPDAITGYMDDYGLTSMGHRRWIIYPQTQLFGTGDMPGDSAHRKTNALHVFDDANMGGPRPAVRDGFVAWPPPIYVPYQVVFAYWTISYPGADFSNAAVTVTSGGATLAVTKYVQADGYGENTLVWKINSVSGGWPKPAADTPYHVTVANVMVGGQARTFSYTVTVFDPGG